MTRFGSAGLFLVLLVSSAGAQVDTVATPAKAEEHRTLCWRARPAPRCGAYVVTELTYERAVVSTTVGGPSAGDDIGSRWVLSVGPMVNRGPKAAWGLQVSISTDDPDEMGVSRIEGRYRKWLGPTSGLDYSLGLAQASVYTPSEETVTARGLTAGVRVEQGLLGVNARMDLLHGGGEARMGGLVGVGVGGAAAPLAAVVLVVGFIAAFAAFGGGT